MPDDPLLAAGTLVRLKSDPGRQGVLTGHNRERAGVKVYQVSFVDGRTYQPEYELEVLDQDNSDPFSLLKKGRFGRLSDLRRNLSYIQLSGRLANLVYSMNTTNTDFYAYQFKPVLNFLESPSSGLLIADEVGLGKTIEAGLIWTELRARYDARRLLVVCPAMLREKWRDELSQRFGVEATIMGAKELTDELKRNRHDLQDGKGIVCSFSGLRPPKDWREGGGARQSQGGRLAQLLDEHSDGEPIIDLVIIDEAHYLRNPETQTAKLGQLLRGVSENFVLLTATPINLKDEDLFHLNLVDPILFDVKEVFPQVLRANEPLQKARSMALDREAGSEQIKTLLREAQTHHLLAENRQLGDLVEMDLTPELLGREAERIRLANRIEKVNLLSHAVNRTRKAEVIELRVIRDPYTEFIELDPEGPEWKFYCDVTNAVRNYAAYGNINAGFLLASPQRQVSSCMYAAAKAWTEKTGFSREIAYEDVGIDLNLDFDSSDLSDDEQSPLLDHLASTVLPNTDIELLRANDSKYHKFRDIVKAYLLEHPGEKIVVFSYFRPTLHYLSERLKEEGLVNEVLMGGMKETKQDIINRFERDAEIKVLLSSEVASEGVDLQFCRVLINYDLPWNPMKVEQRIGRIDRIGQKSDKITIWNLCYANTIDQRIHERLLERLGVFERALGGLEAILGEQIKTLTIDLLKNNLTPEEESIRIDQTAMAIVRIRQDKDDLEKDATNLIAHGGYILEQVQAAHDFDRRITEQDLVVYVQDYLEKYCQGHQFHQLKEAELVFEIRLPAMSAAALEEFISRKKLHGQSRLATGETVRCEFANKVRWPRQRNERISQFHPFVRFISEDLRARDEAFFPLVAVEMESDRVVTFNVGQYAFGISRWEFRGLRVEEELRARVVELRTGSVLDYDQSWDLINAVRISGNDWLSAGNQVDRVKVSEALDQSSAVMEQDFKQARRERENQNKDRVEFQVRSAERHKIRQLETLERVLLEHRNSGRTRLIAPTEGRIRKVKERFDVQVEKLTQRAELKSFSFEVCYGVISIR